VLAEMLRDALPGLRLITHCGGGNFKNQFRRADRSGAAFTLLLGEDEVRAGTVGIKPLRSEEPQIVVAQDALVQRLKSLISI
jgi:histidyl-tRNA synthetase